MSVQGTLSAAERSIRSVFVGNIPYEATEEQLKDIFSEVGPVVSFRCTQWIVNCRRADLDGKETIVAERRLVYDRETGKPKGYGFCEYKDQETALSAMRNLNGYELNGRALRVDNAASEKNKEELKNLQASLGGPPQESPYGTECDPDKAPEAISKAVASLPPEQMFELMKQMKLCIQNNPSEARSMLLQNPQLAYALLQAQVVMRIVDPQVAMTMLHRPNTTPTLVPDPNAPPAVPPPPAISQVISAPPPTPPTMNFADSNYGPGPGAPRAANVPAPAPQAVSSARAVRPLLGDRLPPMDTGRPQPTGPPVPMPVQFGEPNMSRDFDMRDVRTMDPRNMGDRDMRMPPGGPRIDPRGEPRGDPRDLRGDSRGDMRPDPRGLDPRADPREMQMRDPRMPPGAENEQRGGPGPGPGGPFGDPRFRGGPEMLGGPMGDMRGGPMGDMRGGPMGDSRGGPMGDGRSGPMGDSRGGPMGDSRGGPMGDSRGGQMGDSRGGQMGDSRGGPMGDSRGGPMGDSRGGPMGDSRGGPMGDNRGGPMGDSRGGPMGDSRGGPMGDSRGGQMGDSRGGQMGDSRGGPMGDNRAGPMGDMRGGPMGDMRGGPMGDMRGGPMGEVRGGPMSDVRGIAPPFEGRGIPGFDQRSAPMFDQRSPMYDQRDPRMVPAPSASNPSGPPAPVARPQMPGPPAPRLPTAPVPATTAPPTSGVGSLSNALRSATGPQSQISSQDQEKAALIMQVLQLSDQQIAMLPPEQRQSIMVLKDQIARSTQQQQQQ